MKKNKNVSNFLQFSAIYGKRLLSNDIAQQFTLVYHTEGGTLVFNN